MNAAAKPTRRPPPRARASRHRGAGGTLLGVFIGLVLGLGLAAGVAYYLMKANGPFPVQGGKEVRDAPKEPQRTAKADTAAPDKDKPRFDFYKILPGVEEPKVHPEARRVSPDRTVVDQAKAGSDRTVAGKAAEKGAAGAAEKAASAAEKAGGNAAEKGSANAADRIAAAEPTTAAKLPERFWLQAGSFASESDAENLKARLAFAGWQASVQQGTLPDKGTRYRVRLGPYDNPDELKRIRSDLAKNGFEVAVIKF